MTDPKAMPGPDTPNPWPLADTHTRVHIVTDEDGEPADLWTYPSHPLISPEHDWCADIPNEDFGRYRALMSEAMGIVDRAVAAAYPKPGSGHLPQVSWEQSQGHQ